MRSLVFAVLLFPFIGLCFANAQKAEKDEWEDAIPLEFREFIHLTRQRLDPSHYHEHAHDHEKERQRKHVSVDLDALEEQWMEEDMDEDDIPNDEYIYQEVEKRRMEAMEKMQTMIDSNGDLASEEFVQVAKEAESAGKAPMAFARLTEKFMLEKADAAMPLSWKDLAKICDEWLVSSI